MGPLKSEAGFPPLMKFENGELLVEYGSGKNIKIPAQDIRLIGESTNQDGPFEDDWFWHIALDLANWFSFPVGMKGLEASRSALNEHLGISPSWSLANCADFNSVIHYPASLVGKPLFSFQEQKRGGWTKKNLFGYSLMERSVAEEVKAYFQEIDKKS